VGTKDSHLADQLRRAATSVPLNLNEGVRHEAKEKPMT
jgi:four helix bundle protein